MNRIACLLVALAALCLLVLISGCSGGSNNAGHVSLGAPIPMPSAIQRVASLRPLRGIAYKPSPSDYNGTGQSLYYDSDFTNDDFRQLWGPAGRDDLGQLATAGVNFLHLYDWNQPGSGRHHANFLTYCQQKGIAVAVPISAYYVVQLQNNAADPAWFDNFVSEVYPNRQRHPSVVMWSLGNEFDNGGLGQTAQGIALAAQAIVAAEDRAGIPDSERIALTSPVTFGIRGGTGVEGADATLQLKASFSAVGLNTVFASRYIASVNSFNPGSDLGSWASTRFPQATNNLPFCLFEMGKEIGGDVTTEDQQGAFTAAQLAATLPIARGSGPFLGQTVFETVNEAWKGGTEATFGVYKINVSGGMGTGTTTGGQPYPIDSWTAKPSFTSMKNAYSSP